MTENLPQKKKKSLENTLDNDLIEFRNVRLVKSPPQSIDPLLCKDKEGKVSIHSRLQFCSCVPTDKNMHFVLYVIV